MYAQFSFLILYTLRLIFQVNSQGTNSIDDGTLCNEVGDGQVEIKGSFVHSTEPVRLVVKAVKSNKYFVVPIKYEASFAANSITKVNINTSIVEFRTKERDLVGASISPPTQLLYVFETVAEYHGEAIHSIGLESDLLINYSHSFKIIHSITTVSEYFIIVIEDKDFAYRQLLIDEDENYVESILTIDVSKGVPETLASLRSSVINNQIVFQHLVCFADGAQTNYHQCAIYNFETAIITPKGHRLIQKQDIYHKNAKKFIGCPLTKDEFCADPQIDAAFTSGSKHTIFQGSHYYIIENGVIIEHRKSIDKYLFKYIDTAFKYDNGHCVVSGDAVSCPNVTSTMKQLFGDSRAPGDAAFSYESDVFLLNGGYLYRYKTNERPFGYKNGNKIRDVFRGVPNDVDAAFHSPALNQTFLFKNDKYFIIYQLSSGSQSTVKSIANGLVNCGNYSGPIIKIQTPDSPDDMPARPGADSRMKLVAILVPIFVLFIIVIVIIIVAVLRRRVPNDRNTSNEKLASRKSVDNFAVKSTVGATVGHEEQLKTYG